MPRRLACTLVCWLAVAGAFASPASALPGSIAALGDSLTRGWGSLGVPGDNPSMSWSTGDDTGVNSHYLRLLARSSTISGHAGNWAVSGTKMFDTYAQASSAVSQGAQYVTILSGTNDVCTATVAQMTSVADYSTQLQATLVRLTTGLPQARIVVASIPNWYGLWQSYQSDLAAQIAWATSGRCPDLLGASATDADRLAVDQRIKDFNAAAAAVCAGFWACTYDGGAIFGLSFASPDLAAFDYFHLTGSGQALVAAATWTASPYAFYDTFPIDSGCGGCNVAMTASGELVATIQGGADALDTAYGLKDFGGAGGLSGRVYTRTVLRLAPGQALGANLAVFQVRDATNAVVYELYLGSDRILRLWSPAGGLRAQSINLSTGIVVPNDGTSSIRAEVSALANNSVIVRVNDVDRITVTGLSGATTGNQRYLRAGIDHYDTGTSAETVRITHGSVATSQAGWLGAPGGPPPPPVPSNTALPTISGTAQQGQTLTASNGSWTNSPTGYAYQWQRCDQSGNACVSIGTNSPSYTLTAGDVNFTIRVVVTASNAGGPSSPATSAQTAVVQAAPPATNLAPNPGFESDPSTDYFTAGTGTFTWASDAFHGGARSLKLVSNQAGGALARWLSVTNRIAATPGTAYTASAWFKTSGAGQGVRLAANFWNSSLGYLGFTATSASLTGTQDWTQLSLQTQAPAGTAYIRIEFRLTGPGTFWADDLLLTKP